MKMKTASAAYTPHLPYDPKTMALFGTWPRALVSDPLNSASTPSRRIVFMMQSTGPESTVWNRSDNHISDLL